MIYCVVPEPMADELYPRLAAYYAHDPTVTVNIDRRRSERRGGEDRRGDERQDGEAAAGRREIRDRRRARAAGDFPRIDPE
jgi:hypothetical protein